MKILDKKRYRVRKLTPTEYGRLQAFPMEHWEQVVSDSQAYKQFGNAVTTTVATGVAESITDFLSHVGILKEDTTMEEMNKATSAQAQTENPAIAQITAILQPKKERLTELMNEESQLRTEGKKMPKLIQTTTTETETTWKGLANLIKGGGGTLKIGDIITEKTLDGEEMDLVVVDMGPDWARFESKDCLPMEVAYNQNNRNAGGFADSDVKRYLNEEVFNNLPEELRNVIAEVERKQENGESSLCRLFLPTESELFGDCCYSEDDTYNQIEYYKDRRNRIKCNRKGGSPDWYWTASVRSGDSTDCVYVNNYGDSGNWIASYELCVPVCFVIQ